MNLRELALQEATLKALADLVKDRLAEVRSQMQSGLDAAEKDSGTRQIAASLPDGTAVATLSLTDPKPEARVIDEAVFKAWVIDHYPSEIERRFITEVRAAFADKLLAEMTAAGTPRIVDKETGELHEVPGVSVKATRARNHSLRFKPEGRQAIAEAWWSGAVEVPGVTSPAQLPAGGEQ